MTKTRFGHGLDMGWTWCLKTLDMAWTCLGHDQKTNIQQKQYVREKLRHDKDMA